MHTPADLGLDYREVSLRTSDDVELQAWFLPARNAVGALLFSHGNAGNIEHRIARAHVFMEMGLSVLLYDYRGYGNSAGSPTEEGTYLDAESAYDWLVGEGGVAPEQVAAYGESLGGAVTIELARRRPLKALFVESTFTSIPDVGARHYPFLPVRLLSRIHYDSHAKVAELDMPLLVAHSPEDGTVPFELGRKLFDAAGEPKTFLKLEGGHNGGGFVLRQEWRDVVRAFLRSAVE